MPRHNFKAVGHENGQTKTNFTGKNYDLLVQFCIIFGVCKNSSGKKGKPEKISLKNLPPENKKNKKNIFFKVQKHNR
jgi:hypothetical protein